MTEENIEILKNNGVGVIPTDTVYGLVGCALSQESVKKISDIKNRTDGKGFIVLISSIDDLDIFGIEVSETARIFMKKFWPGKVSIEFVSNLPKFNFLKKIGDTIAFRLPNKEDLIKILKQTGPLVAPSANPEGQSPAKNITEAKKYFGDKVDFYQDGGELDSAPSTLVRIVDDKVEVLRQGSIKIDLQNSFVL
jgi:L-threonylcarbamoyladenylate synthase